MDLSGNPFCAYSKLHGIISPSYFILKEKINVDKRYFSYVYKTQYVNKIFFKNGKGISFENRWVLTNNTFLKLKTPFPPLEEQIKIANYLDEKCKEIDNLITDKMKQLEVLEQYKKSIIYEYVTGKKEVI